MFPYSESMNNEPKVWTKVSGYDNIVIFKKFPNKNTIDYSVNKFYVPYQNSYYYILIVPPLFDAQILFPYRLVES